MGRPRLLLTTGGGAAGTTAIGLLADVRDRVELCATDTLPYSYARELADHFAVTPAIDGTPAYRDAILRLVARWKVTALIPSHHAELLELALIAAELARAGVAWPSVTPEIASRAADKRAVYLALQEAGLPVPEFGDLDGELAAPRPDHPRVIKPRDGTASLGQALLRPGAPLPDLPPGQALLVQRWVAGIELSLDGVVLSNGTVLGPAGRIRCAVKHGMAVVSDSVPVPPPLHRLFHETARAVGTTGALNVQVIVDEQQQPWVIDVNPRFPAGGMALSAAQGLNLPRCVALDLLDGPHSVPAPELSTKPLRHYRWYTDAIVAQAATPPAAVWVSGRT